MTEDEILRRLNATFSALQIGPPDLPYTWPALLGGWGYYDTAERCYREAFQ